VRADSRLVWAEAGDAIVDEVAEFGELRELHVVLVCRVQVCVED
jgi:hypothetical protein